MPHVEGCWGEYPRCIVVRITETQCHCQSQGVKVPAFAVATNRWSVLDRRSSDARRLTPSMHTNDCPDIFYRGSMQCTMIPEMSLEISWRAQIILAMVMREWAELERRSASSEAEAEAADSGCNRAEGSCFGSRVISRRS